MKKFSFAKIVTLIFVCAMLLCALTVTTAFATDDNTVEIVKTNVFFGETNQLMFAINAPAGAELSASYVDGNEVRNVQVVPFTKNPVKDAEGNYTGEYVDYIVVDGVECKTYILKEGVAAQAIETVITFTVEYEGTVATKDYSVLQYMYERMNVKKNVEGAELNMFNALLAYAEAADIFLDGTPADQTISNYKYVTVVDGTLDGSNTSGMFLPGETPFENIVTTKEYDNTTYNVEWSVSVDGADAVQYDNNAIKTLKVSGNMTVTAVLVESACQHEWSEATCTTPATCSKCRETMGELSEHTWVAATCEHVKYCSVCEAEEGELADHIWSDWTVTDATCVENGSKTKECDVCGETVTETILATGTHENSDGDLACDSCGKVLAEKITITFDNESKRTEYSTSKQVWSENGIVFTGYKGGSSSDVNSAINPIRVYKSSYFTVECSGMSKIIIYCPDSEYAGGMTATSGTVSVTGSNTVIEFGDSAVDSVTLTAAANQVRIAKIEIYVAVCEHINSEEREMVSATCTEVGYEAGTFCNDCGRYYKGGAVIAALGHDIGNWTETTPATCTTKGEETGTCVRGGCEVTEKRETAALGHTTSNGTCERCGNEIGGSATATSYSYTFSSKQFAENNTEKALGDIKWTISHTGSGTPQNYDSTKGQQFGSKNSPYQTLTFTSDIEAQNVTKVVINTCGASGVTATISVWVNGQQIGESKSLTTTPTNYTFESPSSLSGIVEIRYQISARAVYLKTIQINP